MFVKRFVDISDAVNSICLICVDIDFVMQHCKSDVVRKILILMSRYNWNRAKIASI